MFVIIPEPPTAVPLVGLVDGDKEGRLSASEQGGAQGLANVELTGVLWPLESPLTCVGSLENVG